MRLPEIDMSGPDNMYVNIIFQGSDVNSYRNIVDVNAEYDNTRCDPFITKPGEYYASVIRFTAPLDYVPLFIVPIVPAAQQVGPFNPNLSTYVIGIAYNGIMYPPTVPPLANNVIWETETYSLPPQYANPAATGYDPANPYWWAYEVSSIVSCINKAILVAFAAFAAANPAAPQATKPPPQLVFNATEELLYWYWDITWGTTDRTPNPVNIPRISINQPLNNIINGFDSLLVQRIGITLDDFERMLFVPTYANTVPFPPAGLPAGTELHFNSQDLSTLSAATSIRKIIVTSNSLATVDEAVPVNGTTGSGTNINNNPASESIVADFIPQFQSLKDIRSIAYYIPSAQYRLMDLLGYQSISRLDFQIQWVDTSSNKYPVILGVGQQASLKLAFIKKSLVKNIKQTSDIIPGITNPIPIPSQEMIGYGIDSQFLKGGLMQSQSIPTRSRNRRY